MIPCTPAIAAPEGLGGHSPDASGESGASGQIWQTLSAEAVPALSTGGELLPWQRNGGLGSGGGCRWAFSLSNAGATYAEFRNRLDQLGEVSWAAVEATVIEAGGYDDPTRAG